MVPLETLPDDARLWVFPATEPVCGEAAERLLARVDEFLGDWRAHGDPLTVGRAWRDDRFLVVAVDERTAPPSGCSIDALVRVLKELEGELGIALTDHVDVLHRAPDGAIRRDDRPTFARRARAGEVDLDTPVFDTTLTRLSALRQGRFEVPVRDAWHRRAFFRSAVSVVALLAAAPLAWGAAGARATAQEPEPERAGFVTLLGQDTLVVERFQSSPGRVEADVLFRSPRVALGHYVLETDDGGLVRYHAELRPVGDEGSVRMETLEWNGRDYVLTVRTSEGEREQPWELGPWALPFVDQAHWPFDVALRRAVDRPDSAVAQTMFSGPRAVEYRLLRRGEGAWGFRHPSRGTSAAWVDDDGRLVSLDGRGTTRALLLERVDWMDIEPVARTFAGRPLGELSGRGESVASIDGATLSFDYGTPSRRGREIFGELVAFGEVWRTGANQATHFTTDRELLVDGELVVPPGAYTLFSIPQEAGAVLIINSETGQAGTAHDPAQDLGRVQMRRASLGEPVEVLCIDAMDMPVGGEIEIVWDRTRYWVPFVVR
jgi:hypothetical protein